jgi:hypothetical protein
MALKGEGPYIRRMLSYTALDQSTLRPDSELLLIRLKQFNLICELDLIGVKHLDLVR